MPSHSSLIFLSLIVLHNILELNSSSAVSLIFRISYIQILNMNAMQWHLEMSVLSLLIFCGNLLAIYFKTFPVDWAASRDSQVTFTQSRVSESLQYFHSRTSDFWISAPCSKSLNSCDSVQNCSSSNPTYLNLTVASQFSTASKLAVASHTIAYSHNPYRTALNQPEACLGTLSPIRGQLCNSSLTPSC